MVALFVIKKWIDTISNSPYSFSSCFCAREPELLFVCGGEYSLWNDGLCFPAYPLLGLLGASICIMTLARIKPS